MPAVDYERVLVRLKAKWAEKPSWSKRQLFELSAAVEVECEIPEDQQGFDGTPLRPRSTDPASNDRPAHAVMADSRDAPLTPQEGSDGIEHDHENGSARRGAAAAA